MKIFAATALSLATLAPFAAAAGYTATWTQEGDKCDGAIILGEYTASESCTEVDCAVIPGVTGQGARTTCVDDHITGANAVLKDSPYVLVEVYPEGSNCEGKFGVAVAVTANGECIPGTNGKASYNVTMGDDNTAVWLQYTTPDCTGAEVEVPFTEEQLNGKTCTGGFLKALGSKPAAAGAGSNANSTDAPAKSGYTAKWTVEGDKCDGSIWLGEYTKTDTCTAVDCAPIEGVTTAGAKTTCVEDHIEGAAAVLKDVPYVLVEVYAEKSDCKGDFGIALAVTANGACIPGTDGKASYNVTMGADNSALWLQYTTPDCTGDEVRVPFPEAELKGEACTGGFLKAWAIKPASAGGNDSASTETPVPSTTSGSAAASLVGAAALSVAAVFSASLL